MAIVLESLADLVPTEDVRRLKAGDRVCVSVSSDGKLFETIAVRITSRRGSIFRAKPVQRPRSRTLIELKPDSVVKFTGRQIHSILDGQPSAPVPSPPAPRDPLRDLLRETASMTFKPAPPPTANTGSAKKRSRHKLRVEGDESRRFIRVPVSESSALHAYLRGRRVRSAPPQPYFSDFDCIQLLPGNDVKHVQSLLDAWR